MARNGEIDPWNIDIIDITDKFLRKIEEREKIDLRVSRSTLLYASILLRMKSDILVNAPPPVEEYMDDPPGFDIDPEEFPVLEPRLRHVAARPVTLQELIEELKRARDERHPWHSAGPHGRKPPRRRWRKCWASRTRRTSRIASLT